MNDNTAAVDTGAQPAKKSKPGRPIDPNSVLAKCKELFLPLVQQGMTRPEIVKEFQTRFGLKPGSSQVYYHDAKNAAEASGQQFTVKRAASKRAVKAAVVASADGAVSSD